MTFSGLLAIIYVREMSLFTLNSEQLVMIISIFTF